MYALIETAPKDGTPILLYSKNGFDWAGDCNEIVDTHNNVVICRWADTSVYGSRSPTYNGSGDGFILIGTSISDEYNTMVEVLGATHWAPMPLAPEEED